MFTSNTLGVGMGMGVEFEGEGEDGDFGAEITILISERITHWY